jgi:hypothetical protein
VANAIEAKVREDSGIIANTLMIAPAEEEEPLAAD